MISLSKSDKSVREYSPNHICDEPSPAPLTANMPPVKEFVPQKHKLATSKSKDISYTRIVCEGRRQHLASVFTTASCNEVEKLRSLSPLIQKEIKKHNVVMGILCGVGCALLAAIIALIVYIATNGLEGIIVSIINFCKTLSPLTLCAVEIIGGVLAYTSIKALKDDNENNDNTFETLKTATDVFICTTGANTPETAKCIQQCKQTIEYEIFRPSYCKNQEAYTEVVQDKHDVFVVYSNSTQRAVIIDPKLFE